MRRRAIEVSAALLMSHVLSVLPLSYLAMARRIKCRTARPSQEWSFQGEDRALQVLP